MGGTHVRLVMQKKLTRSDMDIDQHRLSLPKSLWKNPNEFLTADEEGWLNSGCGIPVSVIQPCLQLQHGLQLKKWRMGKTYLYVLIGEWSSICSNITNGHRLHSQVQIWSFRVAGKLMFAVTKV